jgi:signal transduction histidine kinase
LTNLLDNSARYSQPGAPIGIAVDEEADDARLTVHDQGPGIAPEEMPHLFDRFFQAERARERRRGGLGLGLYITKGLVEANGGRIAAQSIAGQGTTFEVRLPLAKASAAALH